MADVKISALPASTTPLAGTEVLPIVQSSTTKQVAVADLTAGRAVSASSLTLTTPLSVANGGTGLTSLTSGYIPYGNGTGAFGSSSGFVFDGSNLGLGVTPSAWSAFRAVQVGHGSLAATGTGSGQHNVSVAANAYFDGANWRYITSSFATEYRQNTGAHQWAIAPSGTAGSAISFTQAMTLDASGNLLVGTATTDVKGKVVIKNTPSSQWTIDGYQNNVTVANNSSATLADGGGLILISDNSYSGSSALYLVSGSAAKLIISTNTFFVNPTTTPSAGQMCIAYDSGSSRYKIYNNVGQSITFAVIMMNTRPVAS